MKTKNVDNNDNGMTFFGNSVHLCPCGIIFGPCASRSIRMILNGRKLALFPKKSSYSLITNTKSNGNTRRA